MNNETWQTKWHPITDWDAQQITTRTTAPDVITPCITSQVPFDRMNSVTGYSVSMYSNTYESPEGVKVIGEGVIVREDEDKKTKKKIGKSYALLFGLLGSSVVFNGLYKRSTGHHFPLGKEIADKDFFGHVPKPPSP